MHHMDRRSQYTSEEYRTTLEDAGAVISMSRKRHCWDNAPAESVFSTVNPELQLTAPFSSHDEARDEWFRYIVWCNHHRRFMHLHYLSAATYRRNSLPE